MNATAFKQRFLPCSDRLFRIAYALTGSREDAEDMLQETFLKLWDRRDTLENVANVEAYTITVLKHVCLDYLRTHPDDREKALPEVPDNPEGESLAEQMERHEEARQAKRLIARLPQPQRQVMWLRDVSVCTFEEIERLTGLTAVNIRVTLSRARKKVREQFNQIANYENR